MANYWERTLRARINRRRALATTGAGALGAILVAACGDDDDNTSTSGGSTPAPTTSNGAGAATPSGDTSGLLSTPVDTTSQAKPGGVLKTNFGFEPVQGFDPLSSNHGVPTTRAAYTYQRLLKFSVDAYPNVPPPTLEGDVAESFELSGDKLTLTLKLRQGIKWDSRAPTNGRELDMQDVLFSWSKFTSVHPSRSDLAYDAQGAPFAPIESVSAPDSRTLVFKLRAPDVSLLPLLATWDHLWIMPRESDGGFDPKADMRGSGPYLLEEYEPSVRFVWSRNPEYYVKDRPFPDRIEEPLILERAQQQAQFRVGNIYTSVVGGFGSQEDVIPLKKDAPDTLLRRAPTFLAASGGSHLTFGFEGDSPWKDVRLRQALSMTIDREVMIDVVTNSDRLRSEGLEVESARNTILLPGWQGYWLDPTNESEFGPNAKYLNYNLDEAKKLLAAADHPDGVEVKLYFVPAYSDALVQVASGMFSDAGFQVTQETLSPLDWFTDYYAAYAVKDPATGKAKGFNGVDALIERPFATVPALLYGMLHKDSGYYKGVSPDGLNVEQGDPMLNDVIENMRGEFDVEKQQEMAQEVQRHVAGQTYLIPNAGSIKPLSLTWPALANAGVYNIFDAAAVGGPGASWSEGGLQLWIDETKAPLA